MGHKRLNPTSSHARHIAVRLTDQDRAWVMEQARARGVSAAAILRAGLALLRAPQGASPDLLVGGPVVGTAIGAHDAQRQRRYEYVEVGVDSLGAYRRVGGGPKVYDKKNPRR